MSSDGNVILFDDHVDYRTNQGIFTLQAIPALPDPPAWATVVGKAYRLATTQGLSLTGASLLFSYLESDVNPGEEQNLRIYYQADGDHRWQMLYTVHDRNQNQLSAPVVSSGIYAVLSSVDVSLSKGWNLFGYPVRNTTTITNALASVVPTDTVTVYAPAVDGGWLVYDTSAPPWVNDPITLSYGAGYYLYASHAITLQLKGAAASAEPVTLPPVNAVPAITVPVVYYGVISNTLAPSVTTTVTVSMNNTICGESRLEPSATRFKVKVDGSSPCVGSDTQPTIKVGGQLVTSTIQHTTNLNAPTITLTPSPTVASLPTSTVTALTLQLPPAQEASAPQPISSARITSTVTPTATLTPAVSEPLIVNPTAGDCTELVIDGGFEQREVWQLPLTDSQARIMADDDNSGNSLLLLGLQPDAPVRYFDTITYSSAYQAITIPTDATQVTLRLRYWPQNSAPNDNWRVALLDPISHLPVTTLLRGVESAQGWRDDNHFDLNNYRGRAMLLYFEVRNDSHDANGRTAVLVDDVSIQLCGVAAHGKSK